MSEQKNNPPWRSHTDDLTDELIKATIIKLHPGTTDDQMSDLFNDWDNWVEAMEYVIAKLQKQLEG